MSIADTDDINQKIFRSIADVFQQAQLSYAGHRKHIAILKKIQDKAIQNGFEESFNYWFNKFVLKILPLKKNEIVGDRIVKLIAAFIASLDKELAILKERQHETFTEREQIFNRFVDGFIRYILRGIDSKDKNVRYRVLQLLVMIMDNLGEIDEELYNLLIWSLNKRIYDKEGHIRTQAVFCLTKFQDETTISEDLNKDFGGDEEVPAAISLMHIIQNDPSPDVRRAAMLNLIKTPNTLSYILERARDINSVNRRLVYSRVLKSMDLQCFEKIDFKILDQLIKWGLEDRDDSVRNACEKLISYHWINLFNGDLIELLEHFNIIKSISIYPAVMRLLNVRDDIINRLKFPEGIWKEFTVEIAFLFRCLFTVCVENEYFEVIDEHFPEAAVLAEYVRFYSDKRFLPAQQESSSIPLSRADRKHLDFIIEQLLITADKYDFSDEIGRRSMLSVIRNLLSYKALSEPLIRIGHKVLKKLSINEKDFVTMAIEIINDLRDEDIELQEQVEREKNKLQKKKNKQNKKRKFYSDNIEKPLSEVIEENEEEEEEENDEDNLNLFHSAVDSLVNGKENDIDKSIINSIAKEREPSAETIVICLTRSSCMLELVNEPLEQNILIMSLIETLITPAVRNSEPKVRELGVRNLGLCCLLDIQLAIENIYILGMCVSKGDELLKKIALQAIVDIFSIYGNEVVNGKGKVDSISLHKMFYKVLKNSDLPECQVVAAEGLCKLFLADIFTDDDLFETLVLSYFSPANATNEPLIQVFAFSLPVYCLSHPVHQVKMSKVAADVLLRLCILWGDLQSSPDRNIKGTVMLKPNVIIQQLIHWTDPRKVVNKKEEDAAKSSVQLDFLLDLLHIFSQINKKDIKRMILTNINNFYVTSQQPIEKLKQVQSLINDFLQNETLDNLCKNSLTKFNSNLSAQVEAAMLQFNESKEEDRLGYTDQELSQILDESMVIESENSSDKEINDQIMNDNNGALPTDMSNIDNNVRKRNRTEVENSNIKSNESLQTISSKSVNFVTPTSSSAFARTQKDLDAEMSE